MIVDLQDRLLWMAIGAVLGYTVRVLQDIRSGVRKVGKDVESVKEEQAHIRDERGEAGLARHPFLLDVVLLGVVLMVAWASYTTHNTNEQVQQTQRDVTNSTSCNQQFLGRTIDALNERTTYSAEAIRANVDLQKAQTTYLNSFFEEPAPTEKESRASLKLYLDSLTDFVELSSMQAGDQEANPFPTVEELQDCLANPKGE